MTTTTPNLNPLSATHPVEDLKELIREEQSAWHFLFENSAEAIVVVDRNGSVVEANQSFINMLGYSRAEIYQLHIWDWDINLDENQVLKLLSDPNSKSITFETNHLRKDQSIINVEISSNCSSWNNEPLVICFCRDTTQKRRHSLKLQSLIMNDSLTGLLNRRSFDHIIKRALQRAQEDESSFSMILLDIDHFKRINDEYGHLVGDKVLIELAELLKQQVRDLDSVARWGGEEFALILPKTSIHAAVQVAERIRQSLANLQVENIALISASLGVTDYQQDDTLDTLFKRADEAIYRAKENGRNCVVHN